MVKKIFPTALIIVSMFAFSGMVFADMITDPLPTEFDDMLMPGDGVVEPVDPDFDFGEAWGMLGGGGAGGDTFQSMSQKLISLVINPLIAVLFAIALLYFLWGVVKYIGKGDEEAEREKGRQMIINGIIGLAVMTAVWGLVLMVTNTFFSGGIPATPTYPTF